MLQEIKKVEEEITEKIAVAKTEAGIAIQQAINQTAEARTKLEETLRQKESETIAEAEKSAEAEADKMIKQAEKEIANQAVPNIDRIADELLQIYLK